MLPSIGYAYTGPDLHYQISIAMKAERTSNRAATADDVIRLAGEHLTQEGCVGFSDTWRPDQFSSFFSLSAAEPKDVARLVIRDLDLMSALGTAICDHTRSEWLKMMLREHAALTQDLSAHLDVKLRQKGYTKVECEQQGLRRKLIAFLEAHLPNAIEIPKFKVYLLTPAGGVGPKKEKTDLFFPWNCSFTDFLGTLCDCTAQSARLAGHNGGYTLRDGSWKYRLVCGGKMDVDCEPQSICNEGHLRGMIKKLTCNTTHASVWHVGHGIRLPNGSSFADTSSLHRRSTKRE